MSKNQSNMFNKKAAQPKYKADKILETLAIQPGQRIADLGSGGGFFTFRFAQAVGEQGQVYAIDTNQKYLDNIQKEANMQKITTIQTILTPPDAADFSYHQFDMIFLRNVTHHLKNRIDYLQKLKNSLKPDGKLVIIEYDGRGGFFSFQRRSKHFIPTDTLINEAISAGYKILQQFDFLPEQSFTIFTKN